MAYEGKGCFKELVKECQIMFDAFLNIIVIQPQSMSGTAAVTFKPKEFVFEVGDR